MATHRPISLSHTELRVCGIAGIVSASPGSIDPRMVEAMADCGCRLNNAFMQHSLLALVVIPELRISDKGIIDVRRFERTGLFV